MTLDEAIKHTEEVAIKMECEAMCVEEAYQTAKQADCEKCAEEHRQLAEWLRDYKRLLEQEPCEDAVSRQAVLDLVNSDWKYEGLEIDVASLPPVIPQQKTGHWEDISNGIEYDWGTCNKCKARIPMTYKYYEFCPHCGAKMESEVEE